jgi:hypothetical protein
VALKILKVVQQAPGTNFNVMEWSFLFKMSTFYIPVPVILCVHLFIRVNPRQALLKKNFTLGSSLLSWSG